MVNCTSPVGQKYPLTPAERLVNWDSHRDHIVEQRYRVEKAAAPTAKRIALCISDFGLPTAVLMERLERMLFDSLGRSVRFGYREAKREIRAQRMLSPGVAQSPVRREAAASEQKERPGGNRWVSGMGVPAPAESILAYAIPDAGKRARVARAGLPGIYVLIRERAHYVAYNVVNAATDARAKAISQDKVTLAILVAKATASALHNSVLELVGESLNLGRTAGAMDAISSDSAGGPVPMFAMRSEQLDERTCDECDALHGEIAEVDTSDYYALLPPEGCLGGGRCRGIMVFGE